MRKSFLFFFMTLCLSVYGQNNSTPPVENGLLAFSIDNNGRYSKLSGHNENGTLPRLSGHRDFTMFAMFKIKGKGKEGVVLQTPMGFIHIKTKKERETEKEKEGVTFIFFKDRNGRASIDNNAKGPEKQKAYLHFANVTVDKEWHSVALVADNKKLTGYFDGIKYSLKFQGTGLNGHYKFTCVGYSKYEYRDRPVKHMYFSGDIKKVAIYGRALSAGEIKVLVGSWRN